MSDKPCVLCGQVGTKPGADELCPPCNRAQAGTRKPQPDARPAHPATMIGRRND